MTIFEQNGACNRSNSILDFVKSSKSFSEDNEEKVACCVSMSAGVCMRQACGIYMPNLRSETKVPVVKVLMQIRKVNQLSALSLMNMHKNYTHLLSQGIIQTTCTCFLQA